MWQAIRSFFSRKVPAPIAAPARIAIVALAVGEQDRRILEAISGLKPVDIHADIQFEMHFAGSCEEALSLTNRLTAPVIVFDRDWPGTDWRIAVEKLAGTPHGACVVLMSGVGDDYLWQELIRRGGYDVLGKPLKADDVARLLMLALSYWRASAWRPAAGTPEAVRR